MIIKFDSNSLPDVTVINAMQIRMVALSPVQNGWYATDPMGDVLITDGDYLLLNSLTDFMVILRVDYLSNSQLQTIVYDEISSELVNNIATSFGNLAVTDAVKLSIMNTVISTMVTILSNKFTLAQSLYTATATTTNFTAGIKSAGLTLINNAIAKL